MERRAEHKVTATNKRSGKKAREIHKEYPKAKADALIAKLRAKGLFYFDPDFEGDEEEIYYYVGAGTELKDQSITSEAVGLKIKTKGDKEVTEALIAEGAALAHGAMPAVPVGNQEGSKAVVEAVTGGSAANGSEKPKSKKRKTEKGETTEVKPKTWLEPGAPAQYRHWFWLIYIHRSHTRYLYMYVKTDF